MAGFTTKRLGNRTSTGKKRNNRRRLSMTSPVLEMLEDRRMLAIDTISLVGGVLEMEVSGNENVNISTLGDDLIVTGSGGAKYTFDSATYFGGLSATDKLEGISLIGDSSPATQQLTIASNFGALDDGVNVSGINNVTFQGKLTGGDFDLQGSGTFSVTTSSGLDLGALIANFGGNISFSADVTAESIDLIGRAFSSSGSVAVTTTGAAGISIETTQGAINARGTYSAQGDGGISLTTPSKAYSIQTDNLQTDGGTLSASGGGLWVFGTLDTGSGDINLDGLEGDVTLYKGLTAGSLSAEGVASFGAYGTNPVTINGGDLTISATFANVRFQGDIATNGGNVSLESPLEFRDVRVRSVDTDGGDFYVKSGSFYNNFGDTLDAGDGDVTLEVASNIGVNGPVTVGSFAALGAESFRGQNTFSITASTGDIRIDSLGRELLAGGTLETTSSDGGIYLNSDPTQRTNVADLKTNGGEIVSTGNIFVNSNGSTIETNGGHVDLSGHTGAIQIYGAVIVGSLEATNAASFTYNTTETFEATVGGVDIETTAGGIQITADIEAVGAVSLIAPMSQFVRIHGVETQGGNFLARGREFRNENGDMIVTNGGDININVAELALIRGDVLTDGGDICLTADTLNASTNEASFDTSGGYATFNVGTADIAGSLDTDGGTLNISLAPTSPNYYPEGSPVLFTVGQGDIVFNDGSIVAIDPYKLAVSVGDKFDLVRAADGEIINVDDTLQVLSVGLDKAGNDIVFDIFAIGSNGINPGERLQVIAESTEVGTAKDITAFGPGNYRVVRDEAGTFGEEEQEDDFILLYRDCLLIMRRPVELVQSIDVMGADGSDDSFTIDLSGGNPIVNGGVNFDGMGGFDEVFLINGNPETTIYNYLDATSGTIEILGVSPDFGADEGIFTYTDVEQINDENTSDYLEFYFTELADDATLENSALGSQITAETFTNTLFTHPNISIFIDGLEGDDIINIGQEEGVDYVLPGVDLIIDSVGDDVQMNVDFLSGGSFIIDAGTFTAFDDTAFNLGGSALFVLSGDLTAEGEGDRTFIASGFDILATIVNFNNANLLATGAGGILLESTEGDVTTGDIEASFAEASITLTAAEDSNVSSVTTNDGLFTVTGVNLFVDETGVINTGTGAWDIEVTENFEVSATPSEFEVEELHFEGFEDPAWTSGQTDNWQGPEISRVASGTGGIDSFVGSGHAVMASGGPFTRFGGYRTDFGLGFSASLAVYLDPAAFADGQGFDYTVAANRQDNTHLRDFMFHVGMVAGELLVNASNNTDGAFNAFKLLNENGGFNYQIEDAGWYTLEQVFRNDGGALAVDFNLRNSDGDVVYTVTRSNPADDIATIVGGNRYGWMIFNDINGLAVDNTQLTTLEAVPARTHMGGDITVSAANMILEDSSITASGDVDIDVTGSLTMLNLETTGTGATIDINAGDAITLADLTAVDGTTTVLAENDIVIGSISTIGGDLDIQSLAASVTTADISTMGGLVDITAATDITVGSIDTSGVDGGIITLTAEGNISTDDLTSQDANIHLDAGGAILSGNGATGGGNYTAFADGDVTVGDVASLGGNIDLTSGGGDVTHGNLDSSGSGGDITILAVAGSVTGGNITTGGGDLLIDALGNILVGMINADGTDPTDGTVLIESEEGSVTTGSIVSFGTIDIYATLDINAGDLETTEAGSAISLFGDQAANIGSVTTNDSDFNVAGVAPETKMQNLLISADGVINTGTGDWNIELSDTLSTGVADFEGFSDPDFVAGVESEGLPGWNNRLGGEVQRVASGTDGINSLSGNAHAIITNLSEQFDSNGMGPFLGSNNAFTRFDGYSTEFGDGLATSIAVYLDPTWNDEQGFAYSVAVNDQDGNYLTEAIFNVGIIEGELRVNGDFSSPWRYNAGSLPDGSSHVVSEAGWYLFEHVYHDAGDGTLAADLNLRDSGGTLLYTTTRTFPTLDIATEVGGNRYGWFTYTNVDGLAFDNVTLTSSSSTAAPRTHVGGNVTINSGTVALGNDEIVSSGDINILTDSGSITAGGFETTDPASTLWVTAETSLTVGGLTSNGGGIEAYTQLGDMLIGSVASNGGDILLDSGNDLAFGSITSGGGDIDLDAVGNITFGSIDSSGSGGDVSIDAGGSITGGDITTGGGDLTMTAAGDIVVGDVDADGEDATDGTVSINGNGSVSTGSIASFGDIEIAAVGDITTGPISTTSEEENEGIVLLSSSGGAIDVQGNIDTDSSDVTAEATGDVTVQNVTTNGGNITLIADNDEDDNGTLTYGNLISGGGTIVIKGAEIVAGNANVVTGGGDFELVSIADYSVNNINTSGGSVSITVSDGNFIFNQINTTADPIGGNVFIDVSGYVEGTSSTSITTRGGELELTAGGDVTMNSVSLSSLVANRDTGLNGAVITSETGSIETKAINADNGITLFAAEAISTSSLTTYSTEATGNGDISAIAGGAITITGSQTAAGGITVDGESVEITSTSTANAGDLSIQSGSTVNTGQLRNNSDSGQISVDAEGNVTIASIIGTTGAGPIDVSLSGDAIEVTTIVSTSGSFLVGTSLDKVGSLTIGTGLAGDEIDIQSAGAVEIGATVTANGGDILIESGSTITTNGLVRNLSDEGSIKMIAADALQTATVSTALNATTQLGWGDIWLQSTGGSVESTGTITSQGDVNIAAGTTVSTAAISLRPNAGLVDIAANGAITISGNISTGIVDDYVRDRSVTIVSDNSSITAANISNANGDVTLASNDGGEISTGTLSTRAGSAGNLSVTTSGLAWMAKDPTGTSNIDGSASFDVGDLKIGNDDGIFNPRQLTATTGDIAIEATGDVEVGTLYTPAGSVLVGQNAKVDSFSSLNLTGGKDIKVAANTTIQTAAISININGGVVELHAGDDITTGGISVAASVDPEGGVSLTSDDGSINTDSISAVGNVSLVASNEEITVSGNVISMTGNIDITADGRVWLSKDTNGSVTAAKTVDITAGSLLVSNDEPGTSARNITAGEGISILTDGTVVTGTLTAIVNGNVDVVAGDSVSVTGLNTDNGPGDISVSSEGDFTATSTITSAGDVLITAGGTAAGSSGSVDVAAITIRENGGEVVISAEGDITATGNITVNANGGGGVSLTSETGDIETAAIYAYGDLVLNANSGGAIDTTTLNTRTGSGGDVIIGNTGAGMITVSAAIISDGSILIGTEGSPVGGFTATGNLNANGVEEAGQILIYSTDDISTSAVATAVGAGDILLDSDAGSVTASNTVTSQGNLTIESGNQVSLTAISIRSDGGAVSIDAANEVTLTGNISIGTVADPVGHDGSVTITSGKSIDAQNILNAFGDLTLTSTAADAADGDINAGTLSTRAGSEGDIVVSTLGNVWISRDGSNSSADGGIDITAASLLVSKDDPVTTPRNLTANGNGAETDLVLTVSGEIVTGALKASNGSIIIDSIDGAITTGGLTANGSGDIEIDTTGDVTILANSVAAGIFKIGQPGDFSQGIPDVSVGQVSTQNVTSGGYLAIIGDGGITTGTLKSNDDIVYVISENGDLTINGTVTSKNELALVAEGNLEAGNLTSTDNLIYAWVRDTPGGQMQLGNINGAAQVIVDGSGSVDTGAITSTSKIGVTTSTGPITVSGNVSITAGGPGNYASFVSLDGSITLQGSASTTGASFLAQTNEGGVTLNGAVNTQGGALTVNSNEDVAYTSFNSAGGELAILSKVGGIGGGNVLSGAGDISLTAETDIVTGTISGQNYNLDAQSYTITGNLTNAGGGDDSSVALNVDAALINDDTFVELLTVTGTWTLAAGTEVNVDVDGVITDPAGDLPLTIASANSINDQGAVINTEPVDDYFAEFDLDDDILELLEVED